MPKRRQLALSLVAGAGLLWIASPVVGQPQQEIVVTGKAKIPEGYHAVKRNVSIKGLDLSTPAGAAEMERRVAAAVEWICQSHLAVDKEEQSDSKLCSDFAWASARPQMDRAIQRARGH